MNQCCFLPEESSSYKLRELLKITDMWMSAVKTMFLLLGSVTVLVDVGNVLLTGDISIALCFVFTVEMNVVQQ